MASEVNLSKEEKISYLRLALNLQHIGIDEQMTDRVLTTYERIMQKGGDFTIKDAVEIELLMDKKYAKKRIATRKK